MKHLYLLPLALLALAPAASKAQIAQSTAKATEIQIKVRKVDLLNQILPVLMTADQIKKILPTIEKARADESLMVKQEEALLREMEKQLDDAIKAGTEKAQVPTAELLNKIVVAFNAIEISRTQLVSIQGRAIVDKVKEVLNEGQIKAAANALDPRVFSPGVDPATVSDDDKLRYWCTGILLDPLAYDLLVSLSTRKTPSAPGAEVSDGTQQ